MAGPVRQPRPGRADRPAPAGLPRRISELTRAAVVALACQLPAATGVPLSRWTGPELLAEIIKAGLARQLSASSVLRILAEHPVKPWQYQSWISPRDPDFAARASVILDLYQGFYRGKRLRPGDRILSVDAKPSIQARGRCRPTAPARPGKPMRVEHEYVRHGALALLAALDVHTGTVFAATPATTGIVPFMDLIGQVMSLPEYKDAPRVFVIVDNGSDHRGQAAVKRLHDAWPNAIMIHTPVHASWLNQAEIFFSITQKKAISPNDFASLDELAGTLLAFVDRYNQTARLEHPEFGGDSILPRCSCLGDCCLPRYRRLAEPRSDHFSAFVLSNICPAALSSCPAWWRAAPAGPPRGAWASPRRAPRIAPRVPRAGQG